MQNSSTPIQQNRLDEATRGLLSSPAASPDAGSGTGFGIPTGGHVPLPLPQLSGALAQQNSATETLLGTPSPSPALALHQDSATKGLLGTPAAPLAPASSVAQSSTLPLQDLATQGLLGTVSASPALATSVHLAGTGLSQPGLAAPTLGPTQLQDSATHGLLGSTTASATASPPLPPPSAPFGTTVSQQYSSSQGLLGTAAASPTFGTAKTQQDSATQNLLSTPPGPPTQYGPLASSVTAAQQVQRARDAATGELLGPGPKVDMAAQTRQLPNASPANDLGAQSRQLLGTGLQPSPRPQVIGATASGLTGPSGSQDLAAQTRQLLGTGSIAQVLPPSANLAAATQQLLGTAPQQSGSLSDATRRLLETQSSAVDAAQPLQDHKSQVSASRENPVVQDQATCFRMALTGEIESAQMSHGGGGPLMCVFCLQHGADWTVVSGVPNGITQLASASVSRPSLSSGMLRGGTREVVWNFPVGLVFKSTSPFGWPRLVVSVYGTDLCNRRVIKGYGSVHIPCQPGRHQRTIRLYCPISSSPVTRLLGALFGNPAQLIDPRFVAGSENREMVRVQSGGSVRVVFDILLKDTEAFNYSF